MSKAPRTAVSTFAVGPELMLYPSGISTGFRDLTTRLYCQDDQHATHEPSMRKASPIQKEKCLSGLPNAPGFIN